MDYYLESTLLISSEALPVIIGAVKFRKADLSIRIFLLLCATTLVTELLAIRAAMSISRNNMTVYNSAAIIMLVLLCLYFSFSIENINRKISCLLLSLLSIAVWIIAVRIGGSIKEMHSLFLYYQYILLIFLGIVSIYKSHKAGTTHSHTQLVHFWISLLVICSGCLFFIQWGIYDWILVNRPSIQDIINGYFTIASFLLNLGFCVILFLYKKTGRHVS